MKQYEVSGAKNELFTIDRVDDLEGLDNIKRTLIENDKEPKYYYMRRVTEGTRKKSYTILAIRFNSGKFLKLI